MKKGIALIIAAVLLFLALGMYAQYSYYRGAPSYAGMPMMGTPQGAQPGAAPPQMRFSSNGEMIYYTGVNIDGERIVPKYGGPMWLYNHGGSCVSCHGEDGRGGRPVMMCPEIPPDIRYSALTEEMEHGGEEEHPPYNKTTIKRAITRGLDPAGEELNPCMPRWAMGERDLEDLILFLKRA
ncbi:MAG: c-type cytochrome [Euryarchaeota archaeon]|nr:c-type cytochrome [Euryarchaeota archaeon]